MPLQMPFSRTAAPTPAPATSPELVAALEHGLALQQLLQDEFEALRVQDLDGFEALQDAKLTMRPSGIPLKT